MNEVVFGLKPQKNIQSLQGKQRVLGAGLWSVWLGCLSEAAWCRMEARKATKEQVMKH